MTWESSCSYRGDCVWQALCWSHPGELGTPRSPLWGGDGDREGDVQRRSLQPGAGHGCAGCHALGQSPYG